MFNFRSLFYCTFNFTDVLLNFCLFNVVSTSSRRFVNFRLFYCTFQFSSMLLVSPTGVKFIQLIRRQSQKSTSDDTVSPYTCNPYIRRLIAYRSLISYQRACSTFLSRPSLSLLRALQRSTLAGFLWAKLRAHPSRSYNNASTCFSRPDYQLVVEEQPV